jgi:hypothetical protein
MSREGAEEGRRSMATFPSPAKIYSMTSSSPATASPRLIVGQLREVEEERRGGKWQEGEGSRGVFRLITGGGALGLPCTSSETIGRHGQLYGAALYAEFRDVVVAVGGGTVRSGRPRVQTERD